MTGRPCRVLFCTLEYPPGIAGGAEQQASLQAAELVRRGHQVDVVCPRTPGQQSETRGTSRVYRLPRIDRRPFRTVSYLAVLAGFLLLRMARYDIVHVHLANAQADVAVALAAVHRKASYLKVAAGGPLGEIGRFRNLALLTRYFGLRHASAVQAISSEIRRDLFAIGVAAERIHAIPNGVVIPDRVDPAGRSALRHELRLPEDSLVVLYAGRMERDKGVADLLDAWTAAALDNATLVLIGSLGIKDPVPMDRLPPGVEYRGWSSAVGTYLRAADLFVLPSHVEGMSNALLEAMATGVACIATRVGAAEAMIEDGQSGLLVTPGRPRELGDAITRLAHDSHLRRTVSTAGRQRISDRYSIERVTAQIEAVYEAITGR